MPVIGFGTKNVGTLRLWQAESVEDFDFAQFDCGNYDGAVKAKMTLRTFLRCFTLTITVKRARYSGSSRNISSPPLL